MLPGRPWVSLTAAVTSGGQTCVSLAVVQIAIRSPRLASSQGRLLTVPQTIAKVDDEACGPRAESSEQSERSSRKQRRASHTACTACPSTRAETTRLQTGSAERPARLRRGPSGEPHPHRGLLSSGAAPLGAQGGASAPQLHPPGLAGNPAVLAGDHGTDPAGAPLSSWGDSSCLHRPECPRFLCTSDCHTAAGIRYHKNSVRSSWALRRSVVGPRDLCF